MRAGEDEREAAGRKGHAYLTTGRVGMGSQRAGQGVRTWVYGYIGVAGGPVGGWPWLSLRPLLCGNSGTAPAVPLFLDPAQFFLRHLEYLHLFLQVTGL